MEIAYRQKKSQEGSNRGGSGSGGGSGEGFFYGGSCHMTELQVCDSHHNFLQQMHDMLSTKSFGELLLGDLQLVPPIDNNSNEAMAAKMSTDRQRSLQTQELHTTSLTRGSF